VGLLVGGGGDRGEDYPSMNSGQCRKVGRMEGRVEERGVVAYSGSGPSISVSLESLT